MSVSIDKMVVHGTLSDGRRVEGVHVFAPIHLSTGDQLTLTWNCVEALDSVEADAASLKPNIKSTVSPIVVPVDDTPKKFKIIY
jgi:hypothetical protein